MSDTALMVRDDACRRIAFTPEANEMRNEAVACASLITVVNSPATNEAAVDAQRACRRVIKLVEDTRVAVKAPVIEFGRAIDDAARRFVDGVKAEELRVAALVGDYQQAEIAKAKAVEAARQKEITEAERQREEALMSATTLKERDQIQEEFNASVAALPVVNMTRVSGQTIRDDWEITVTDVHALYRSHPLCCSVKPMLSEIRQLLDSGITPAGVVAKKVTKAGVRLEREPKAIAV